MSNRPDYGRRTILQAAAAGAACLAGPARVQAQPDGVAVKWSAGTERPVLHPPVDATDSHHHIYDARFPVDPRATVRPGDATVADYRMLQKRLGTTRHVVVQPSTYGTDNRCLLDALAQFGPQARGIAVVDTGVTDAELQRLHAAGIRGIRFNLVEAAATTTEMLAPLGQRVHALGWHIQFNMAGALIPELAGSFAALPCPIVIDHIGHIQEPQGVDAPGFQSMLRLAENGRTWVKLSGAYLDSLAGPPSYRDVTAVARVVAQTIPDRIIWGSDWPHPTAKGAKPDDALLLDLVSAWVPHADAQRRLFVSNPAALFGFPE